MIIRSLNGWAIAYETVTDAVDGRYRTRAIATRHGERVEGTPVRYGAHDEALASVFEVTQRKTP